MKAAELLTHATCTHCGKPIGHTGVPFFHRVIIQQFVVDLAAVRRADGLAALLGNQRIAAVVGPDEDLANPFDAAATVTLCEHCAASTEPPSIAELYGMVRMPEAPAELAKADPS